jgi:hypothetical protein
MNEPNVRPPETWGKIRALRDQIRRETEQGAPLHWYPLRARLEALGLSRVDAGNVALQLHGELSGVES